MLGLRLSRNRCHGKGLWRCVPNTKQVVGPWNHMWKLEMVRKTLRLAMAMAPQVLEHVHGLAAWRADGR